ETYRAQVQYLKDTVVDLKAGRREEAFARLEQHGDIREVQDLDELRQQAVDTHLEAVRAAEGVAILISPIHSEARVTATLIRDTLKAEGLINSIDHAVTRLIRLDAEGIELRDPLHYQPGRVVVFHTKVKGGFRAREKWKILEQETNGHFKMEH